MDALVAEGVDVVVSGLCVTFDGRPFEPLPALMAIAEDVLKLTAVCAVCGEDAAFHQRLSSGGAGDPLTPTTEQVGGIESYQARCRRHFTGAARPDLAERRMPRPGRDEASVLLCGTVLCGAVRDYCSIGCGASLDSCAWIVGEPPSDITSILRGLAFSLTGIVTLSTPLL